MNFDRKMFHRTNKNIKIILRKYLFLLSAYFNIRWLWDAYRVPTWMDFGLKNPPTSALGRLLGRPDGFGRSGWGGRGHGRQRISGPLIEVNRGNRGT